MTDSERLTVESTTTGYTLRDMCTYGRDGEPTDEFGCEEICDLCLHNCDNCPIQKAFDRLAEYENTGLSPEEIMELKKRSNIHLHVEGIKPINEPQLLKMVKENGKHE
ncbi:MAG: hypothetical protein ACI4KO_09865 [Ruminiclostridium sp.]